MPAQDDDVSERFPLGRPIRPETPEADEWVPVDPSKPHIQRHIRTGMFRNTTPAPLFETIYGIWGLPTGAP